jgi:hypothetical protein
MVVQTGMEGDVERAFRGDFMSHSDTGAHDTATGTPAVGRNSKLGRFGSDNEIRFIFYYLCVNLEILSGRLCLRNAESCCCLITIWCGY